MSRHIRTLLKKNRILEEKIFYEPRETDWREQLITTQELSDALSCLANRIIENENQELCVLRMLNDIDSIDGRPLPAFEKNALQVVEILFNYIREHSNFDSKYYHILNSLQLAFTRLSLNDLSFLDNSKHVAVRFLEQLITLGHHFDKDAGKLSQYFIHAIELLIDRLANRDAVTNQTFMMAHQKLEEYFEGFNEKVDTNTAQILSEIEAKSKAAQADKFTEQLIKSKTQGEEMPIFLLDFFENHITPVLHNIISLHGVNSKQTQQLLTDMDTLTWSITCPYGDPDYNTRFEADVESAMKRIYLEFRQGDELNEYVKDFFIEIEQLHSRKLQGHRVDYDVMISADIFADEEYEKDELESWYTPATQNKFDIAALKEGTWYHLELPEGEVRSRLLLISELTKELVFVNLSGELTLKVSFDDTEYLSEKIKPTEIDEAVRYAHATKSLTRELTTRLELLKSEYQKLKEQKARDDAEQRRQEEEAKLALQKKIEEERRQQVLAEQEAIKKAAEKQAEERRLEELDAQERFFVKSVYRKLTPGVLVAYQEESGKWREVTLSLISKTTSKHIFSDNKGNKITEPTKDELFELIKKKRIKVLKEAEQDGELLQSLVRDRRKQLSQI